MMPIEQNARASRIEEGATVLFGHGMDHAQHVTAHASGLHQSGVIPSLDGIRAVSVLLVVLGHSGLQAAVPGGLGVTIFFFLSGYLISTLMITEHERTGSISIPHFYARRVFRLMPPYYGLFFDPGDTVPYGTGILWSLAVEEHFYIFYPLLLTLLLGTALTRQFRTICALLAMVCLAVLAWRIHLVHAPGVLPDRTYYGSDTRIDSIIYGCMLALVMNPARQQRRPGPMSLAQWAVAVTAAGVLLLTLVYRDPVFRETVRYSIQGLALMPLFYFAVRFSGNWPFRYLNSPLAVTLGIYSYSIYLIHDIVIHMIDKNLPAIGAKPYLLFPAALLISIAYAAAIDRFVDPFFRRLRHKFR
jgi:peptidoglycan/LPS O-acetylase OafA/YrhL